MDYKTVRPKKIIETNTFFSRSGKTVEKNIKIYDDAGMILSEERFDKEGNQTALLTYVNDTINRIILSRTFQRKTSIGLMIETAFYTYDSSHFLVRVTDKSAAGNVTGTTVIRNNEKGLPVELITYDAQGNAYGKEIAEYFYERNISYQAVYNNNGQRLSIDSTKISFKNAHQFPTTAGQYNDKGDPLVFHTRFKDGTNVTYEYEYDYDEFGNIVEQRIFKVTITSSLKRKKEKDRIFKKKYTY